MVCSSNFVSFSFTLHILVFFCIFDVSWHPSHFFILVSELIEDLVDVNEREGITLTCKQELVSFYEKFGFVNHGVSDSQHGGIRWYNMVKLRKGMN